MKLPSRSAALLAVVMMNTVAPMSAQAPATYETCRTSLDEEAMHEQRELRATLYGLKPAADAGISEVRFAGDGSAWIKIAKNAWRSTAEGYERTTWSDTLVDDQADHEPRAGIFEARRRLGTELVPSLTQAMRSFQCRLADICATLEKSDAEGSEEAQQITVNVDGCVPVETETFADCHLARAQGTVTDQGNIRTYCSEMTAALFERETDLLKMTVEYDAAYRSVVQLSGIIQGFLGELRTTILGSLRSATLLIGNLGRIPCFVSSCADGTASPENP